MYLDVCIYKTYPKYDCLYIKQSKNIKHVPIFAPKLGASSMFPIMQVAPFPTQWLKTDNS